MIVETVVTVTVLAAGQLPATAMLEEELPEPPEPPELPGPEGEPPEPPEPVASGDTALAEVEVVWSVLADELGAEPPMAPVGAPAPLTNTIDVW